MSSIVNTPITLETATGKLGGALEVPVGPVPCPVVLMISGSGPTDRNGNSLALAGRNNSLEMLANRLALAGLASVRYDKRGVAASRAAMSSETDIRFDHYVDDAAAWVRKLKEDKRFSSVIVIGHSEGSLIGMIATLRAHADGFVSLAGAGYPIGAVIRTQMHQQFGRNRPDLERANERILSSLEQGKTTEDIPGELAQFYRPSVQPYLVSWLKYDPRSEIAKLTVPILLVQGTTDIQVGSSNIAALAQAQPRGRVLIIQGMNHVLKDVAADTAKQLGSYADPTLPVDSTLVNEVAAFAHLVMPAKLQP